MSEETAAASGPCQRLGKDGLAFFAKLVGGPAAGWRLEPPALRRGGVEFALLKGPRRLGFSITRGAGRAAKLCLHDDRPDRPEDERAAARAAAAGVEAHDFVALLERLRRDSLLYVDPDWGTAPSRLDLYYRVIDHAPEFWKFVYPKARFLEARMRYGGRYAAIGHTTLECRRSGVMSVLPSLCYFADEQPVAPAPIEVDTDLTPADVLAGRTQDVLDRTVERVAREEKPLFIVLRTTCLPELVGDNPGAVIARVKAKLGVPVFWTAKTRPSDPVHEAMLERFLGEVKFSAKADPKAVALAGIPSVSAQVEATALLQGIGLRVVGALFPVLDFSRAQDLREAGAVVWLNPVGWEKLRDEVFLRRGLKVVRTHPPFGLAGTQAWLERTACVLGLKGAARATAAALKPCAARLDALRRQCRRRTVALVGDPRDVELLASQGRAFGFSPAALLGELGFHVRCLVFDDGSDRALRQPRAAAGAGTIEFVPFSSRAELDAELGRGVDIAFSHLNHDPRLAAHGLLGFTEEAFAPGLGGLLRSAERLLRLCAGRPFPGHRSSLSPWIS